jgi:hypothetical protein
MKRIIFFTALIFSTNLLAAKWDEENNPHHFQKIFQANVITKFSDLPLLGELDDKRLGWSDSYWPSQKGGIAFRWNHENPLPFRYKLHSYEEVSLMNREDFSKLSPAELYDISQSDYTYTLTRKVLSTYRPHDLWWEGICHGWALAAANYPEPSKVLVTNKDGFQIPFGSSDVKALLSMHDAYNSKGLYARIGLRCNARGKVPGEGSVRDGYAPMPDELESETPECKDVNPGAFHIILSNAIGIHGKGVVADVDRFADVWNQPVIKYVASIREFLTPTEEERSQGIDKKLRVMMTMTYGEELQFFSQEAHKRGDRNFVSKEPVTRTGRQAFKFKLYEYYLELNQAGEIIGGEWISLTRPDFVWMKKRDLNFNDGEFKMSGLKDIYNPLSY